MSRPWLALGLALSAVSAVAAAGLSRSYDSVVAAARSAMMEDPARALTLAHEAETIARQAAGRDAALNAARAQWLQGEALSRLGRGGAALPVLESALAAVTHAAPADRLRGDILLSRGWIEETDGAIARAFTDFQQALKIYRASGDQRGQARALQNIGGIYQDAGDNQRSLRYYAEAEEIYHGDPAFSIAVYNNVGETLRLLGRYKAAEAQYRQALAAARQVDSPLLQANILTNMASTQLMRGQVGAAEMTARRALALTQRREAADEQPFAFGVLAQIAMKQGRLTDAAAHIGKTFKGVDLVDSPLPYRDFHKLAADLYARQGRYDLALAHIRAWKRLDDSVHELAASTNAALIAAQFDFSNQNLRIAQLQANRARLHEQLFAGAATAITLIASLLLIGLLALHRSRNQIRATNRELTKALKVKSDFLATTSHEIRTPLNGILGMTQVLLADRTVAGPVRTKIELVHGAGETMRALVDDILDLSKIETGKLELNRAPLPLRKMLHEAAVLWRAKAEAKGLSLDLQLDDCPTMIEEDGDRLRQILFNLLSNAVKFTETGSVSLSARVEGERLILAVADTGIGIAPEHHQLIFEKFQQADQSTSRRFGGSGLGLAICRSVSDAMDGRITLDSCLDAGATFTLSLPLQLVEPPRQPATEETVAPPVLLLEPNALARRVIAKKLKDAIGEVEPVDDREALRDAILSDRYRWVVLQASAAGDDLGTLVKAATARAMRVVVLWGETDGVDEAALHASGAVPLRKPASAEMIAQALRDDDGEAGLAA